jgi:hypothetical protein
MGQGNCGRLAAAFMMGVLGLSPAFAMDREPGRMVGPAAVAASSGADSYGFLAGRPCPTRFDYLVLASFADAPSLLSLSAYHFRGELGFSSIPLSGLLRTGYTVDSGAAGCRSRNMSPGRQIG